MVLLNLVLFSLRLLPIDAENYEQEIFYRYEIADACVEASADPIEQHLCVKIARFESAFREDVGRCQIKGSAGELTAWQILPRGPRDRERLCRSLREDAQVAIERIRESRRACWRLPKAEQLALYARGSCNSESGKRLSRHRWVYREEISWSASQ